MISTVHNVLGVRMGKQARHNHYLSEFYLKGFCEPHGKESRLTVLDLKSTRHFKTSVRNVGGVRDFNRINAAGIQPDYLEKALSKIESFIAEAIRAVESTLEFDGENRGLILNLMGLLATRNPDLRKRLSEFETQVVRQEIGLMLSKREIWDGITNTTKHDGVHISEGASYEETKRFVESGEYEIKIPRERLITFELKMMDAILPALFARKWLLVVASANSGPFVAGDLPATLVWKHPKQVPAFLRSSPGFEMPDTQVVFPLSRNIALIGEFEGQNGVSHGSLESVARINSRIIKSAYSQVYAPNLQFKFMASGGKILQGLDLFSLKKRMS